MAEEFVMTEFHRIDTLVSTVRAVTGLGLRHTGNEAVEDRTVAIAEAASLGSVMARGCGMAKPETMELAFALCAEVVSMAVGGLFEALVSTGVYEDYDECPDPNLVAQRGIPDIDWMQAPATVRMVLDTYWGKVQ